LMSSTKDISGSEVEWTMGAAMSLLHPAAARAARVDDNAVEGCGAIHAVGGKRSSVEHNQSGGGGWGGGGVNGVVALVLVAVVLFACLASAVFGSEKGGPQRWPKLSLGGKDSVGLIPVHKRP
jgi:hypothetical protein